MNSFSNHVLAVMGRCNKRWEYCRQCFTNPYRRIPWRRVSLWFSMFQCASVLICIPLFIRGGSWVIPRPREMAAAALAGAALGFWAIIFTRLSAKKAAATLMHGWKRFLKTIIFEKQMFLRAMAWATCEECFWRGVIQSNLPDGQKTIYFFLIIIMSLIFVVTHLDGKTDSLLNLIELALFNIIISVVFWKTRSLIIVATIHTCRNTIVMKHLAYEGVISCR